MFTASQVAALLEIPEEQAEAALAGIDQEAIEAEELAAWAVAPYEGGPLALASEATLLALIPEGGVAYVITDTRTGAPRTFQPHAPALSGIVPMTAESAASYGEAERQRIAGEAAATRIVAAVREASVAE